MDIFLLWSNERAEHGESPELEDAFATRELAQAAADERWSPDDYDEDDLMIMYAIERREVKGAALILTNSMHLAALTDLNVIHNALRIAIGNEHLIGLAKVATGLLHDRLAPQDLASDTTGA